MPENCMRKMRQNAADRAFTGRIFEMIKVLFATAKSAFERGFTVIIPEGTNSTFDNDYMTGETTYRYYNEDVWEEMADVITFEEAIALLGGKE